MESVDLAALENLVTIEGELCTDLAIDIIDVFLNEIPERHQHMIEALAQTDYDRLQALAHKTKGTSSGIGAMRLAALYACLEEHAPEGNYEFLDRLLGDLTDEIESVTFDLTNHRKTFVGTLDDDLA